MAQRGRLDYDQIGEDARQGAIYGTKVFYSDGTFTSDNIPKYLGDGTATDSGIGVSSIATLTGLNSWYGQVPRGPVDGSNVTFTLDYALADPHTILMRNGVGQKPAVDGYTTNPSPDYSITGTTLTYTTAPRVSDWHYIWYFRYIPSTMPAISNATLIVWTSAIGGSGGTLHGLPLITWNYPPAQGGSIPVQYLQTTPYSETEISTTVSLPGTPNIGSFSGANVVFTLSSAVHSTGDSSQFNIYDCYLNVTLAGGAGVVTIRPTSWFFYSGGSTNIYSWEPSTAYGPGTVIIDSNGNEQISTNNGTSGATAPAWATSGNTADGSMIWTYQGPQTSTTGTLSNPTYAYDVDTVPPATFASIYQTTWGLTNDGYFQVNF